MMSMFFLCVMATTVIALAYPVFVSCDRRLVRQRLRLSDHAASRKGNTTTTLASRIVGIRMRRQSDTLTFEHTSQCLDDMARRLRIGHSPSDAFVDAVRTRAELFRVCNDAAAAVQRTGDLGAAIAELTDHTDAVVRGFATAVWIAQSGHGVSIAALDRAARSHRDRYAVQQEKRAATSASRHSTLILTVLPLVSVVLSPLWGTHVVSAFMSSPIVAVALIAGVGLNAAGFVWARRIGEALE